MKHNQHKASVSTAAGDFQIALFHQQAPLTAGYFSQLIDSGTLDNSSVYRMVHSDNNSHNPAHPIHVLQGGLQDSDPQPVAPVAHESTAQTGLSHRQWSLSTARFAPGQTYGSFFVCMRDEPALDFGGKRHPDGQGFAVFGQVIAGFTVIEALYQQREAQEYLQQPVPIHRVIWCY